MAFTISHLLDVLFYSALSLVFLSFIFIPIEKAFPAKEGQQILRQGWMTDACFFFGQYLFWNGVVLWLLGVFADSVDGVMPRNISKWAAELPFLVQVFIVVVMSDIFIYWAHRLQHNVPFLWRFHAVHHSAEHLDWLAAHREHPLDTIYTVGIINLPAIFLGFPLESIAGLIAFRGIWAIYIHSNVRLSLGPVRWLIGSPELHHWHHDKDRFAGNYANLSPMMDILFGTYSCPPSEPESFGTQEEQPRSYFGLLMKPVLPTRR